MAEGGQVIVKTLGRNDRCRRLLENEEMCDVTFLVGCKKVPIKANRIMLRHGSSVFFKMFSLMEKEQNAYEIPDLEPTEFRILLDYFYTGEVNMEFKNVYALFQGATLYGAVNLIDQCVLKLTDSLNLNNCSTTLVLALKNENIELEKAAIQFICKNASYIFIPTFGCFNFTEEALLKLLPLDELVVDELQLFKTIFQWGNRQVRKTCNLKQHELVERKELRSVLENIIKHIRFPLIDPSKFTTKVDPTELLNDKEVMAVLLYFNVQPDKRANYKARMFNTKPRAKKYFVNETKSN